MAEEADGNVTRIGVYDVQRREREMVKGVEKGSVARWGRIWRGWLCGAHSASLHLNVKVPSAARRKLLFCIRKLMIASELCF